MAELLSAVPSEALAVLSELFSDDGIEKKTDLSRPLNWSVMQVLASFLEDRGMRQSAALLRSFIKKSFRVLVSKSRRGRAEFVEALRSKKEEQQQQPPGRPGV